MGGFSESLQELILKPSWTWAWLALVPLLLLAQTHCLMMCGPLTAHFPKLRNYLLGRTLSYSLVGLTLGMIGHTIRPWPVFSAMFALLFLVFAFLPILKPGLSKSWQNKIQGFLHSAVSDGSQITLGLASVLLPCGQLWSVFGLSAISQSPLSGFLIAFSFSVLSMPGLIFFKKMQFVMKSKFRNRTWTIILNSVFVLLMSISSAQFFYQSLRHPEEVKDLSGLVCH